MAAESKVLALKTTVDVVKQMLSHRWPDFLASLPPQTRAIADTPPPISSWLPVEHFLTLIDAAAAHGIEVRDVGRETTMRTLRGVHRIFVRVLSPSWVIGRSGPLWSSYYRDWGGLPEVLSSSSTNVSFRFHGTTARPSFWRHITGSIDAICALTRVRNPVVTTESGPDDSTFIIHTRWDA